VGFCPRGGQRAGARVRGTPPLAAEVVILPGPDDQLGRQLAELARVRGITRLHAHFAKLSTQVARAAAAELGVPYSFTAHARDIYEQSVDPAALAERIRDAEQVVTVSRFNVEHLEREFGRRPALLYNGLPPEAFPYSAPHDREPLILGAGRLVEKKGFRVLLDASRLLADQGVSFRCQVVGDGVEREALAARLDALGLADRVRLV